MKDVAKVAAERAEAAAEAAAEAIEMARTRTSGLPLPSLEDL